MKPPLGPVLKTWIVGEDRSCGNHEIGLSKRHQAALLNGMNSRLDTLACRKMDEL